jgi:hypothetical protein
MKLKMAAMAGLSLTLDPMGIFFQKASSLKPHGQMNRNLVGSIYGRSSINIAHSVQIHLQTWPPQAILVSDWWPCLLMDRDEMSILYRGPSIDASY